MKRLRVTRLQAGIVCLMIAIAVISRLDCAQGAPMKDTTAQPEPEARVLLDFFKTWNFDQQSNGEVPAGFSAFTVGSEGSPMWIVQNDPDAPSTPNLLRPSAACATQNCFDVLLVDAVRYEYLDLLVRIRLTRTSPESSGAAGVVFGARDRGNFYAVTVDASGHHLEVLRVQDGKPTSLASTDMTLKKVVWHLLRIRRSTISKEYIEVVFDGMQALSVEDNTFGTGQIGLVTRGPAAVDFDTLTAAPLYSQKPLSGPAAY